MAQIEGEILIDRPVEVVFDFVADQRNEPQYNRHMARSAKVTTGPIGKGTRFRAAVTALRRTSEMAIEYTGYQRPYWLSSITRMARTEFSGTLTFEPAPSGTRMRWSWRGQPKGAAHLLAPLITWMGRRQEQAIWTSMKRYLKATAARPVTRSGH